MDTSSIYSGMFAAGPLDVNDIVNKIIYAKSYPIRNYQDEIQAYEAEKSALQTLNTKVSSLKSAVSTLSNFDSISTGSATVSDEDILTATTQSGAQTGDYYIIVRQLAKAESDSSDGFSSADSEVLTDGTTFSITQNGQTVDIDITGDTRSLTGLRDAINNSGLDVRATVIYDGSEYKLQITSTETGTDYAFTIDDTGVGTNMTEKISAQDAIINVNTTDESDAITRSSNTIDDVIEGVTLNLKQADATKTVTLTIDNDFSNLESKINDFVSKYNDVISYLNNQFSYNEETKSAGPLSGNSAARSVQSAVLEMISSKVEGINSDATYQSLVDIGIRMNNDGTIYLDTEKFEDAIENDYEGVKKVFEEIATTSNTNVSFIARTSSTEAGTYAVEITTAPERASIQGSYEVPSGGISQDETLTITYDGNDYTVDLSQNDTLDDIIEKINTEMDNNNVPITATSNGNYLVVQTDNYGSSETFSIVSNVAADGGGTGIGTTQLTDTGVDIAGTIGGYAATGEGRVLTGSEGPVEGLKIFGTMTSTGSFGNVSLTYGVISNFNERLEDLLSTETGNEGPITKELNNLDTNIKNLNERIEEFRQDLEEERQRLFQEFDAANRAMAQMQQLLMSLQNNFTGISR